MERAASIMERTASSEPRRRLLDGTLVDDGMGSIKGLKALLLLSFEGDEVDSEDRRCSIVMMPFFL